ncbi:MAG TPA: sulfurtransferase TusA family protein [Burkholderiaceae bacterium]|nr:sulfurtransferase TusA family protein [Burkholderiaceae bacterium]
MSDNAVTIPTPHMTVDAAGLKCPLPILRAKKALAQMESGQILEVITTDNHAERDFQAFCAQTGNTLIAQTPSPDQSAVHHYLQRR